MKLTLASESAWRRELLSWLEVPFTVKVSGVDETAIVAEEPEELVAMLAVAKARAVAKALEEERVFGGESEGELVLAADTVVVAESEVIGKPKDRADARRIIKKLAGRTHEVWTGVCMIDELGEQRVETVRTLVTMRSTGEDELENYLDVEEWKGKAGGYQIQGAIRDFVTDVEGSTTNVIGLPLLVVQGMLEEAGVPVPVEAQEVISERLGVIS